MWNKVSTTLLSKFYDNNTVKVNPFVLTLRLSSEL